MGSKKENKQNKAPFRQTKPAQPKGATTQHTTEVWALLGLILVVTFLAYLPALKAGLLQWDDDLYITLNSHIKELKWENIKLFFTKFYAGNYQPFTILTYAIEYKLAGESPTLYHFNNVLLHLINTLLVFFLVTKLSPQNVSVALLTAAFFALHPMHVESVAWVAERKDVLYTFFFLLSLSVYTQYIKLGRFHLLLLTWVLFVFSCLSKSAAVVLPLVMFLFDYYLNRKFEWKTIAEKLPFLLASLLFGVVALVSQKEATLSELYNIPFTARFLVVCNSLVTYLYKAFVPVNLSAFYPYPASVTHIFSFPYFISAGIALAILFYVFRSYNSNKHLFFGFLFFGITIFLVLQIISVGNATMAERYTYVPYIGLFFFVAKQMEQYTTNRQPLQKKYLAAFVVVVLGVFSAITYNRAGKWQNDGELFSDVISKYPDNNPLAYNNRGCYYLKVAQNKTTTAEAEGNTYLIKAISDFEKIMETNKEYPHAYFNRGIARLLLKDYTNAVKDFEVEIARNPKDDEAYFNRANARMQLNDYPGAIGDFNKVIELIPANENVYFNRGNAKKELGDFEGALKDYDKAIELSPEFLKAYNNRSTLRCMLKDYKGAVEDYDKMIELNPADVTTIKNREIVKALIDT